MELSFKNICWRNRGSFPKERKNATIIYSIIYSWVRQRIHHVLKKRPLKWKEQSFIRVHTPSQCVFKQRIPSENVVLFLHFVGASAEDKQELHLSDPSQYNYLSGGNVGVSNVDEHFEYARLMQSMEMVGFTKDKMNKSTRVLSAVLHLGNIEFSKR